MLSALKFVCLLSYVLATCKVISEGVSTCDSVHSWWLYSADPLGEQATSTMTWCPTQSHYLDTEPTSPCTILLKLSTRLWSDMYQFLSHWFDSTSIQTHKVWIPWSPKTGGDRSTHSAIPPGLEGMTKGAECFGKSADSNPCVWSNSGRVKPMS